MLIKIYITDLQGCTVFVLLLNIAIIISALQLHTYLICLPFWIVFAGLVNTTSTSIGVEGGGGSHEVVISFHFKNLVLPNGHNWDLLCSDYHKMLPNQ